MAGDAGTSGAQEQRLLGQRRAIVRAHFTPVRAQPLLEGDPHFSLDKCRLRIWLDAADQGQPVRVVLLEIGIALDERFGVQREKEIRGSGAQRVAKETRRSDPHDREWPVVQLEHAADNGRIRSVASLPQAIAHDGHRRSAGVDHPRP